MGCGRVRGDVCRFIREEDWSFAKGKPKASLFSKDNLSVWHCLRITARNDTLTDLQFGHLEDSGKYILSVEEYLRVASTQNWCIEAVWRPEPCFVPADWQRWDYAHVQIEMRDGTTRFPKEMRWVLSEIGDCTAPNRSAKS